MVPRSWVVLIALSLHFNAAGAQSVNDPRLYPGARVRLTVRPHDGERPGRRIAILRGVTPESVQVHWIGEAGSDTLAWSAVSRIEVTRGVNRRLKNVATLVGIVGGTVLGYELGRRATRSLKDECSGDPSVIDVCGDTWASFLGRYAIAAAGGAAGGGVAILITGRERWRGVGIPTRTGLQQHSLRLPDGVLIGAAIAW